MEKVYMLLRNNRESGPYTIGELRQQKLQSSDLIWIEGESAAWCYPSEVEELNPNASSRSGLRSVPVAPAIPATVVPMPVASERKPTPTDEIEMQAEALRKRALSYTPFKPWNHYKSESSREEEGPVFYRTEDDRIDIVFHRRERNFVPSQLLAAALLTTLAVTAWNYRHNLIPIRQAVETVAAKAATSFETFAKQTEQGNTAVIAAPQQQTEAKPIATLATAIAPALPAEKPAVKKNAAGVTTSAPVIQVKQESIQQITEEKLTAPLPVTPVATPSEAPVSIAQEPEKTAVPSADQEKKKTLGQAIKGLFKKKKKDEEKAASLTDQAG